MTLPRVRAKFLSHCMIGAEIADPGSWVTPQLSVLPVGWSWSLWLCQTMHEHLSGDHGLLVEARLADHACGRALRGSETAHAIYIDNFFVAGHDPATVGQAAARHTAGMNLLGLAIHEEEGPPSQFTFAGLDFDGAQNVVSVSPRRLWRLRMAIDFILSCDRFPGAALEVVVGHITWAARVRRQVLSVWRSCHGFIREFGPVRNELRSYVRRELHILPLLSTSAPPTRRTSCCPTCSTTSTKCFSRGGATATARSCPPFAILWAKMRMGAA